MKKQPRNQRVETVHCLILGLSTFLMGLYFGTSLPAGVDLVVLQSGLIGFLGFLGLTQIQTVIEPETETRDVSNISRSRRVEQRLARHTASSEIHRIDRGKEVRRPVSIGKSSHTVGAVSRITERAGVTNRY